jgi:hypothetical protein
MRVRAVVVGCGAGGQPRRSDSLIRRSAPPSPEVRRGAQAPSRNCDILLSAGPERLRSAVEAGELIEVTDDDERNGR